MPPPKVSTPFAVALFGIAGLVLGFLSIGLLDVMFYTTKAFFFLEDWHLWHLLLFIALFAVSFSIIPVVAARSQHTKHIWFLLAWVGTFVLAGFLISVSTATIHHQTLSIPDGLIPVGVLLLPIVSGVSVVLLARYRRVGT